MTKEKIAKLKEKSELNLSDFEYLDDGSFNELNGEINMAQEAVLIINELQAENEKLKMQWKPIESAPKSEYRTDDAHILVFRGDEGFEEKFITIENINNYRFYKDNGYTHWMPLPESPK